LDSKRDAILKLPAKQGTAPFPLLVLFHGAGENPEGVIERLGSAPDEAGVAVLAPASRGSTWDAIRGGFGRDLTFVNRALDRVFDRVAVDHARIAVGGFSDGATYAISLGLINGDLFSRVVAFSPGFVIERTPQGTPRFFISHGTEDPILPISRCGRPIAKRLRDRGYEVTFREFDGGHEVPEHLALEGLGWVSTGRIKTE
jgi:phospholipase/carboxylesterase